MPSRSRLSIAAAFALLFWLLPGIDTNDQRASWAQLQVRQWLLGEQGPLAADLRAGRLPPLLADVRLSPPAAQLAASTAESLRRLAAEFAAANAAAVDPALPPRYLELHVTPAGAHARLAVAAPAGSVDRQWLLPDRSCLLPALLAIVLAILWRRLLPALLLACLCGAALPQLAAGAGLPAAAASAVPHLFADVLWRDVLGGLQQWTTPAGFQPAIILFVVFLFLAVGIMAASGGIHGMVELLSRACRGPLRTQLAAFATGLSICFDDYTNCIVGGTAWQPVCDRQRVSRSKLAYIVDSTAAPVAGLSVLSTWVAFEVSTYQAPLQLLSRDDGTPYTAGDAYALFVATLPYRFYCLFALLLVLLCIVLRRDFGPMLQAERLARSGQPAADPVLPAVEAALQPAASTPRRARNALLPLSVLLGGAVLLLYWFGAHGPDGGYAVPPGLGFGDTVRFVLGHTAADFALMWAGLAMLATAAALALWQRQPRPLQLLLAALRAAAILLPTLLVLLLAWCLGRLSQELGTSAYLAAACRSALPAALLPLMMFLLAALVSLSTGTSYGTMAILLPNVIALAHGLGRDSGFGGDALLVLTVGAVLEGSIFGDHCSPISDTTVLSSLSTRCRHGEHVATQLPYALLAMLTAAVCGYLPVAWLGPACWPLSLLLGAAVLVGFLLLVGRDPGRDPGRDAARAGA